jgi:hemoglobin
MRQNVAMGVQRILPSMSASEAGQTMYDTVGGMAFFERLVDRFYDGVEGDPALRRLYPEPDDLGPARRRLTLFLAQYWGGPGTYTEERGHPRLRMRHFPFAIGPDERDRWLLHMAEAVEQTAPTGEIAERLMAYFVPAAEAMRNRDE